MSDRTQTETAYQELSHRILAIEITANERIVEEAWGERLGVNRSAIREALTRLLGEGMVYQGAKGGFFVAEMSANELNELREVREILETAAVTLACERATAASLKQLAEACDDFTNFVAKGYHSAAHDADLRFHHLLVAASGNTRLAQVYEKSRIPLFHRKVAKLRPSAENFAQTEREHRHILDALREKNAALAVRRLREHFARGYSEAADAMPTAKSAGKKARKA